MLTENQIKEHLALAYVYAVASRVGCAFDIPRVDNDSVDVKLSFRNEEDPDATIRSPEIALQVKGAPQEDDGRDELSFFLKRKNYLDLVKRAQTPRLLVVVALPPNADHWLETSPSQLVLRRCAYFLNLLGQSPTDNETGITVKIPKSQAFDPPALQRLMQQAGRQERLT